MKQVRIVTDSVGDIPASLASELDIAVIPAQISFGKELYRDGVDLSPQEFLDKLAQSEELPKTAQPPVQDFALTYQRLLEEDPGCRIVSIHVPGNLSGIVNAAWAGAQMLPDPTLVEVVDSGQISMGMGWAVVEAARLAQAGASQAEVVQALQALLPRLRTVAMLDTLENLYKGGRISKISAAVGSALQIKPLLGVERGEILVLGKVRTRSRALKQLVALVSDWGTVAEMAVLHAGAEDLMHSLVEMLQAQFPLDRMVTGLAGSALTTHLGPGAVGVCALVAPDD
jgi:DegV family protein with EDD domain